MHYLMGEMAEYANYPILEQVYKEVTSVSKDKYNEALLDFLTNYTINIQANIQRREQRKKTEKTKKRKKGKEITSEKFTLYNIDFFWEIMTALRENIPFDTKLQDYAMNCLIKIADTNAGIGNDYLIKAINQINNNTGNVVRYMKFFTLGFMTLQKNPSMRSTIITSINKEEKLLEKIVGNLIQYKNSINEKVQACDNKKGIMSRVLSVKKFY